MADITRNAGSSLCKYKDVLPGLHVFPTVDDDVQKDA